MDVQYVIAASHLALITAYFRDMLLGKHTYCTPPPHNLTRRGALIALVVL